MSETNESLVKRREILQLLADGKITADEAATLLAGPSKPVGDQPSKTEEPATKTTGNDRPSWFHVQVSDLHSGKQKVRVNIPLRLLKLGLNIGRRYAPEVDGFDWADLAELANEKGILVDVQDVEDGEHVQIYVD